MLTKSPEEGGVAKNKQKPSHTHVNNVYKVLLQMLPKKESFFITSKSNDWVVLLHFMPTDIRSSMSYKMFELHIVFQVSGLNWKKKP